MQNYLVYVEDTRFSSKNVIFCKDKEDLINLISHLDEERYMLYSVEALCNYVEIEDVCKKNEFERGGG
jgi:hypothetical protein